MRQAERAIFDLRRGLPVLMRDPDGDRLIQAVESLDDEALRETGVLAGSPVQLGLSMHRLIALAADANGDDSHHECGVVDFESAPDSAELLRLATVLDARLPAAARVGTANRAARAAVRLLGQAQLVPAAAVWAIDPQQAEAVAAEVGNGNLLAVSAAEALRLSRSSGGSLTRISEAQVPLAEAPDSRFVLFREADGVHEHVAILIGQRAQWPEAVPVRLHSSCLTGDLFGSLRCDCGEQLRRGVAAIAEQGGGVLLYLSQEGRGIGLANKLRAYSLQDQGLDTIDADQTIGFSRDERNFRVAHEMLQQLEVGRILLLTNNPAKVEALQRAGINVVGRQAIFGSITTQNRRYLNTKAHRHGHWLHDLLNEQGEPASDQPASLPAPPSAS